MNAAPTSVLFSLRTKLIFAFVGIVLVALVIAASAFVIVRRDDQEQGRLDEVIAASPAIYAVFSVLEERQASPAAMLEFVESASQSFDVRVLLVNRQGGVVVADSGSDLVGEQIALPDDVNVSRPRGARPYVSWEPDGGSPGSDLILVSAAVGRQIAPFQPSPDEPYTLLLAVPQGTIRDAWRGLLPGLGIAALISVTAAVVLAVVFARYISRPLQQLTVASQRMAEGTFDVDVSIERRDEVGRLAQSFSSMAKHVGNAQSDMRSLVASVSHDLKTPLTSILGFAQALRDSGGDADTRRMGGVIHDEATRLSTRLNDLLYLSEIESGQALIDRDEVDVKRLIEGVVARVKNGNANAGPHFDLELAPELTVSADGPKLERAVENLIENARKYAPPDGDVHVRSERQGGKAIISVRNGAQNLDSEQLPRLFERFYRGDRTRGSAGSGLGLPIAKDLVELHGGSLDASVADGDVTFTISLPIEESNDGA